MTGAIAQFEWRLFSEWTKVDLKATRAGGRKVKFNPSDVEKAQAMLLDPKITKAEEAAHFRISRPTLNKALANSKD